MHRREEKIRSSPILSLLVLNKEEKRKRKYI